MDLAGSKWRILHVLRDDDELTVPQLSEELDLSITTLREHLEVLKEEDLVEVRKEIKGRGRPLHWHSLTADARRLFVAHDDSLSQILFKVLKTTVDDRTLKLAFRKILILYLEATNRSIQELLREHRGSG